MIQAAILLLFPSAMIFAAASDLVSMTISNKVPLLLIAAFLAAALVFGLSPSAFGLHLLVGVLCLLVTFGCFAAGWMGGGDAKLIAVTALWFGPTPELLSYLLHASLFGGVLTIGLLAMRGLMAPATGIGFVDHLLHPKTGIPYGIALGAAGVTVFAESAWMDLALISLR